MFRLNKSPYHRSPITDVKKKIIFAAIFVDFYIKIRPFHVHDREIGENGAGWLWSEEKTEKMGRLCKSKV